MSDYSVSDLLFVPLIAFRLGTLSFLIEYPLTFMLQYCQVINFKESSITYSSLCYIYI